MDKKKNQHIAIFTTASLPWMTGTAVNPLFRAAYLAKDRTRNVTLVIPWLSLKHQRLVYPINTTFSSPSYQEAFVRTWLQDRVPFSPVFTILFYPAKFAVDKRSILPVGDISEVIQDEEADVAVLEEPEHLTWFHHGKSWKRKFRVVIGVIHTNYLEYARRESNGMLKALALKFANAWVVGIYCHKVIRLSAATQDYSESIICNVHGVNPRFLEVGKTKIELQRSGEKAFTKGAYYIGKMVWSKGYKELLMLLADHQEDLADLEVDLYGNGEDSKEIKEAVKKLKLAVSVHPGCDHADSVFHDYRVFLNPSTTDVVCTTTAEALAMGKIVVCANHPSNEFFKQFPNCRTYDDGNGFVEATLKALTDKPVELTDAQMHELSWESATERFLRVAELDKPRIVPKVPVKNFAAASFNVRKNMEDVSAYLHYLASGFEVSRRAFGAIPKTLQPDDELCRELGLKVDTQSQGSQH